MIANNELKISSKFKYSILTETLATIYPLSEELKNEFRSRTFQISIKKGEMLVRQGDICSSMYYIVKGLTRGFTKKGGQEITTWFSVQNDWETAVSSFFKGKPAIENIQALENCTLEGFDVKDLEYLYTAYPEVNIFVRDIFEEYYLAAERRALMCRIGNASEKYKYFIEQRGDLFDRVPLKYIASFLGMRLETLSRLKAKFQQ